MKFIITFVNKYPRFHPKRQFRAGVMARLTWWARQDPKFMIIGAGKSGTTSLEKYVTQHPRIKPTIVKEIHYFDYQFDHGYFWYRSHFPLKRSDQIAGDFTPSYLDYPKSPQRIFEKYPNMKFVVILRNPVDRAFSQYQHTKRRGWESLDFEKAIDAESSRIKQNVEYYKRYSYLARGLYFEQLKLWFSYFPQDHFLILEYSELLDIDKISNKIFKFLNLEPFHNINGEKFNVGNYSHLEEKTRNNLMAYFKSHNNNLFKLLNHEFDW